MAGGIEITPKDAASTDRLRRYWVSGAGAALVRWGEPGDFQRCIDHVQAAVVKGGGKPLSDHMIKGFCATAHRLATGATPGHAPAEQAGHAAAGGH